MTELLDVLDDRGRHVGVQPRDVVHRDGLWHACLHVWVVGAGGVVLQRRGAHKKSWPGFLDASAAGHLEAGETPMDGLREAEEELGVRYAAEDVVALGVRRVVDELVGGGGVNREFQHVVLVRDDRALDGFAFDARELDGLVRVGVADFTALVHEGRVVDGEAWDGAALSAVRVTREELVPAPYLGSLTIMCERFAAGVGPVAL